MDLSELYRDIIETSPDGIWVIGLDGRTVYANPEIARIHRIETSALAELTVFDTLDDLGRDQFRAHLEKVRGGHTNEVEVEVQWVRSDGSIVWMLCSETALLDDAGRPTALLHRYSDYSERRAIIESLRQSEEALEDQVAQNNLMQAVASAANEAHSLREVLRHARSLVLLHDAWERARGFVPDPDGAPVVVPFYASGDDRDEDEREQASAAVDQALAQRSFEARSLVWDDRRLSIAFPVLLGDEVYAVIVITSAPPLLRHELIENMAVRMAEQLARVAERERAQAELAQARDEAMEASRQKSEFLAMMSHEIRTPLNGVIGLNDLLTRTELTGEQRRLASGVQVASRALLGLLNDILDFSKIEAGRMELEQLDFELRPLLEQVAAILTEGARDKGLDLVVSCHPDVPAVVSGDPTRLAQVVTNLLSNAVKFTDHGGVTVRATCAQLDDQLELRVEVSDTGVGVDEAKLQGLFDPFTQADSSTTRIYGGTGLGLAISREIVEAMGGTLDYRPHEGGGSTFAFTALLGKAADDGSGDRTGSAGDERARELLAGRRALIVDDSETNRLILEEQLSWWGMAADSVGSATEALTLLNRLPPAYDVVLLDLAMPGRNGLDLARELRADPAQDDLLLLMLTSATTVGLDDLRAAGVDDVLAKPVMSSVLRGAMLQLISGETDADRAAALRRARAAAPPAVSKGRILVVEDNPVNQMVATGLLSALGYTTDTADDGLVAIEAVRRGRYDAILMDVQMPRMDGYTATRHIREHEGDSRVPIIAMTAAAVEGERERCMEAGMDDFLTKPVEPVRLTEALERWASPEPGYAQRLDVRRLSELRRLDGPGESSYVDRAIGNFLANSRKDLDAMEAALSAGDAAELRKTAHRFAGSALNLGVVAAGEAARELERQAYEGDLTGVSLTSVEALLDLDLEALRAYRRDNFAPQPS